MFYVVLMNLTKEEGDDQDSVEDNVFSNPAEIYNFKTMESAEEFYEKYKLQAHKLVEASWRNLLEEQDFKLVLINLEQIYRINNKYTYISFVNIDMTSSNILIADNDVETPETDAKLFKLFMDWFSDEDDKIINQLSAGDHHDTDIETLKESRYEFFNYLTYIFSAQLIGLYNKSEIIQK